jgi:hypothetical protein
MENAITFCEVALTVAILANLLMGIIDLRIKSYVVGLLEEVLEGGKPQNILISEGQAKAIAKIVKQLMDEDKKGKE